MIELQKLIEHMDVPSLRRYDLMWLSRNLGIRNEQHPNYVKACTRISTLLKEVVDKASLAETDYAKDQRNWVDWFVRAFDQQPTENILSRSKNFVEEAIELVQAAGLTQEQVVSIVQKVFSKPVGDLRQEVAGAYSTMLVLCEAHGIDIKAATDAELERVNANIDIIRDKTRNKGYDEPQK